MAKKYSPVKVRNPVSDRHLVKLYPTQSLEVLLAPWYDIADFNVNSSYVDVEDQVDLPTGHKLIRFSQKFDLSDWSDVSNFFLGQIDLVGTNQSSLCALLASTNPTKQNVVTICNPKSIDLKFEPNQIIEVVVFDTNLGVDARWDCQIKPSTEGLQLELIGHDTFRPYMPIVTTSPDEIYCSCSRVLDNYFCIQHHFWFRCDSTSIEMLSRHKEGLYLAGKIIFNGHSYTKQASSQCDLTLRVNFKNKEDIYGALLCPKKDQQHYPNTTRFRPILRSIQIPQFAKMKTRIVRKAGGFSLES